MAEGIKINLKSGRWAGALIGLVLGVLMLFPKIIILILLVLLGYWIGSVVDSRKEGAVIPPEAGRKE